MYLFLSEEVEISGTYKSTILGPMNGFTLYTPSQGFNLIWVSSGYQWSSASLEQVLQVLVLT
jgi:hypothetical protein